MQKSTDKSKIDANDMLKRWNGDGVEAQAQRANIQGMMAVAQPLVERMAEAAGEMRAGLEDDETWSQEYEDAVGAVVALALTLDESTLGRLLVGISSWLATTIQFLRSSMLLNHMTSWPLALRSHT